MMEIHLRLFHNSDKLFGVYNGLFDSPVMYPNWGRVSHLLVKLLLSCYLGYMEASVSVICFSVGI